MDDLGGGPEDIDGKENTLPSNMMNEEGGNSVSDSLETETLSENDNQKESVQSETKGNVTFSHPEETRLSGWLGKLGAVGFVKTNRQFWFVFGDDTCKLYYYRNPQDLLPMGEIDISNAFFTFDPNVADRPGLFEIRSEGKIHYLDAQERHRMVYWLQELQRKRREFSQKRTTLSSERVQWTVKKRLQNSGLVGEALGQNSEPVVTSSPDAVPMDNIRITHSESSHKLSQWNLKKEIRDAVFSLKTNLKFSGSGQRELPSPEAPSTDWTILESDVPVTEALSVNVTDAGPVSPSSPTNKSQGRFMSTFKKFSIKKSSSSDAIIKQDPRTQKSACIRCRHMGDDLVSAREELAATEEELQANREIIRLLQKEVDVLRTEVKTMKESSSLSNEDQHEMLRQRDKHIVEMKHSMSSLSEDRSQLKQQAKIQESELKTQKEQLSMYQDMLEAKDQVIMQLTNQIFELENSKGDNSDMPNPSPPRAPVIVQNTKELESLKDTCQAYELQNKFLTKEILELNQLRQNDEAREKMLLINYANLEAEYYKTQSRYLILLNENKAPVMDSGDSTITQDVVSQLLEEAMTTDTQTDTDRKTFYLSSNSMQEYDRYGFLKRMVEEEEENILLARADQLQRQSAELSNKIKVSDEAKSHHVKWENFMVNQSNPLVRSPELKTLIRSGIPHEFREQVWRGCIHQHVGESRSKLGPGYYKSLVTRAKDTKSNPAAKQIELDLLRTLPTNHHFESLECEGVKKLRKVLLAYSAQNPLIGYCQGLNRLAGIALLFLSEEDAFWCLVAIVEHLMPPDYFTTTLAAAQADQRVLKDMVQEKLPKLYSHLEHYEVDLSLFTFNWFLTVFVDGVPPETFLRVWDAFLYEGSKVLFRFAIAFLKYVEEAVLQQKSSFLVSRYMRVVGEKMTDARGICKIAFHDLNPFPMRNIASKRLAHLNQIRTELAELDAIRRDFKSERIPQDRLEYYSDDELDDS